MRTIEAYQLLVLSKGLDVHYDEFAIWWASKGITAFYKNKMEMEDKINRALQNEGLDVTVDTLPELFRKKEQTGYDRWTYPEESAMNFSPTDRGLLYTILNPVINALITAIYDGPIKSHTRQQAREWARDQIINAASNWIEGRYTPKGRRQTARRQIGRVANPLGTIGFVIVAIAGAAIARGMARRAARNTTRDGYNQYRSYDSWRGEYVSDRYTSWEHNDYGAAWNLYLLYKTFQQTGETTLTDDEFISIDWNDVFLGVLGGAGGGGGSGGYWLK